MPVTQFRLYSEVSRPDGGWSNQEIAEFYRIADIMAQAGLAVEAESGTSDENDPWFIFVRAETGDVVAHFARIDGLFVAASALTQEVFRGSDIRHVIDQMLKRHPLMVPRRPNGARLLMHPSVVLTAFVAAAFVMASEDARAHTLDDVLQATFSGPDNIADNQQIAEHPAVPDLDVTARKPVQLQSQGLPESSVERSTGNQLALISALIMACDLAAHDPLADEMQQSGLDPLTEGPISVRLSSSSTPLVLDTDTTSDWAAAEISRTIDSDKEDLIVTTTVIGNQAVVSAEGDDLSDIIVTYANIARSEHITAINVGDPSRDDVIVLGVGEDVLIGGTANHSLTSDHQGVGSQEIPLQHIEQTVGQSASASLISVDLIDLIGAAQSKGDVALDAFITSFQTSLGDDGISRILTQNPENLTRGYETVGGTFVASKDGVSIEDATVEPSAQRASARVPTETSNSSSDDTSGESVPSKETADSTATDNVPVQSSTTAPLAIGHLLRQGEARSLILTDAVDVLLYEGGNVDVHNFELGKDRLWFYLDAGDVSTASYHFESDGDLVMAFASGNTLTLHDVLASDAAYTFV